MSTILTIALIVGIGVLTYLGVEYLDAREWKRRVRTPERR